MEILAIGLATLIIVLWFVILLAWLITFGRTLTSHDAWPESSYEWRPTGERRLGMADEPGPATVGQHRQA